MKTLKVELVILLAAIFFVACGTAQTPDNANQGAARNPANGNSGAAANVAATPAAPGANANSQAAPSPGQPQQTANGNAAGAKKDAKAADARPASNVNAAQVYTSMACAGCHGMDGKGAVSGAPDFTSAAWQKKTSDAALRRGILKGAPPKMPSYEGRLNDEELNALVVYIRSLAK